MITTTTKPATIHELEKIPVVRQHWLKDRWQGIQHGELVNTIHEVLDSRKVSVLSEGWYPSGHDLGRLHGQLELSIPGKTAVNGTSFSLGIQHSNLGDHALKFAVGAKIFICSNGMVVGDYAVKRKHTIGVDLISIIQHGVDVYINRVSEVSETIDCMRTIELDVPTVDKALMQAGRDGLMSWSRIGQVDEEYNKPTFADHNEKTAWGLYNAFTYVLQKMPPQYHLNSMNQFRKILIDKD